MATETAAKATAKSKAVGAADKGLKVTSRPPSFRRAGYGFTAEPRVIPLSELSQQQVDQITNDPSLVSHVVDIEPPPKTE